GNAHTGSEPRLCLQIARRAAAHFAAFFGRKHKRHENVHFLIPGESERGRYHADDGVASLVQVDGLAQAQWIGAIASLPETISDDGRLIVARLHLFTTEDAPEQWRHAEHRQQFGRRLDAVYRLRPVALRDVELRPAIVSDILKHSSLCDVGDVGRRNARLNVALPLLIAPLSQTDKLLRIRIR